MSLLILLQNHRFNYMSFVLAPAFTVSLQALPFLLFPKVLRILIFKSTYNSYVYCHVCKNWDKLQPWYAALHLFLFSKLGICKEKVQKSTLLKPYSNYNIFRPLNEDEADTFDSYTLFIYVMRSNNLISSHSFHNKKSWTVEWSKGKCGWLCLVSQLLSWYRLSVWKEQGYLATTIIRNKLESHSTIGSRSLKPTYYWD